MALALVMPMVTVMAGPAAAQARPPFTIGPVTARPGEVAYGSLVVPDGVDAGTTIPITVAHGAQPGPVLVLVAGVHGAETTPILALQAWQPTLRPAALRGTVVMVMVANLPSFLERSVRVNPVDRKNLNRVFPGDAAGTLTDRIAHVLSTAVIPRGDYVVDIHSGDAHEDLRPWTGYYARIGSADVIARSRAMAMAFGVPYVVQFPFAPAPEELARYTGVVAVRRGTPAFDVEVGRLGNVEPELIAQVTAGLDRLLVHLGMRDGPASPTGPVHLVRARATVTAQATGIFHPAVRAGQDVAAGASIGYVTDFHGRRLEDLRAPAAGHVLHVLATPAVSQGEGVATLATDVVREP